MLWDGVKIGFEVRIYHPVISCLEQFLDSAQRVLTSFAGAKPIALSCKIAFKDRLYPMEQGSLLYSISQSGYSQRTLFFAPSLGYPDPFDRLRLVLGGSQLLLQLRYRLDFMYFNLVHALVVDSGASAFGDYFLQRAFQVLWTPDFIDQPKPFSSFYPRFQGCQHALGPDCRFHPCPAGADLSLATTEALSPPGHSSSGLSTMNAVPFPVRDP